MSVALIPLTIAPFAAGSLNPVTDALLAAVLIIHSHIGFESCVIDYIPTRKYGSFAKIMGWVLKLATGIAFGKSNITASCRHDNETDEASGYLRIPDQRRRSYRGYQEVSGAHASHLLERHSF